MRGGGDVVDIVPIDVGFTAVETEPQGAVHILVAKEVAPFDAGFVVGVAKNGEGGNIVLRAVLLKDAIDLGDAVLAVSAVGGPEDEEFPLVGEGMERMRDVEGVEKDELGGFATDEKALPLVGTGEFFVDGGGRRPEVVFGGVIVLDQVDVNFVIDHDVALQILLGEGDDEILEYVGGSLGALEHGVKVFDDGLGRGVLEDTVVEIHDTVIKDGFGGAKNGIVVEGDIVEIVSEEIVTALVFGKGVARRTQQGGLHIAGGAHHLGEEHVGTLQNHGHFDTVEHEEFLIFIFLELGRVQFANMTGKVFGDLGVDAVKLEEVLVLRASLYFHLGSPVALLCLEFEERFLMIDNKLDIGALLVGEEIKTLGQGVGTFENETAFLVADGCVDNTVAFGLVMAKIHEGIFAAINGKGYLILVLFSGLRGESHQESQCKEDSSSYNTFHARITRGGRHYCTVYIKKWRARREKTEWPDARLTRDAENIFKARGCCSKKNVYFCNSVDEMLKRYKIVAE